MIEKIESIKNELRPFITSIVYEGPPSVGHDILWVLVVKLLCGENLTVSFFADGAGIQADITFHHESNNLEKTFAGWLSRVLGGNYSFRKRGTTTTKIMEFANSDKAPGPGWIGCNWLSKALDWDSLPPTTEAYATPGGGIVLQWGACLLSVDVLSKLADWKFSDGSLLSDLDLSEEDTRNQLRKLILETRRPESRGEEEDQDPPLLGYGDT
jgi:hypothetical protein